MSDRLFDDFSSTGEKEWKLQIQSELQGADYHKNLITNTPEGIDIKLFYTKEDKIDNYLVVKEKGWKISNSFILTSDFDANNEINRAVSQGVEHISVWVNKDGYDIETLHKAIIGNDLEALLIIRCKPEYYVDKWSSFSNNKTPLLLDPIGQLLETGILPIGESWKLDQIGHLIESYPIIGFRVNAYAYQEAGAHIVQQLAYALAHANEYLNLINEWKNQKFHFQFAQGSHYFMEIAKLRAFRLLWDSLMDEYGYPLHPCHIHSQCGRRNKTLYDYNVNMLRTTTEYMSAILGGADTISYLPYDMLYNPRNEFGDRIARNQLLILKHESYFHAVDNIADGSYYIESLTKQLAEKALNLFREIEAAGGLLAQVRKGVIQRKIREAAEKEQNCFDKGEKVLVGINKFSNPNDKMKDNLIIDPFKASASRQTVIEPLPLRRLSEKMERERLRNEK